MEEYAIPKRSSNKRQGKTVSFNPEPPQVLIVEGRDIVPPEPGSVRDRVQKYNKKIMQYSISQQSRPPALPPRNPVQITVARVANIQQPSSSSPPQPPPRARNYLLPACNQQIRSFRRENHTYPDSERPSKRRDATVPPGRVFVSPDLHLRMKVPDSPPPPPPPLQPSAPSADKDDGKRQGRHKHTDTDQEQADRADAGDDEDDDPGCFSGCLLFTVSCIGCIIG